MEEITDKSVDMMPNEEQLPSEQEKDDKLLWYVVHTYSGYENKVKDNLEKTIENRGLEDTIVEVSIPVEETIEIKDGKKKTVQRKLFPGYVLVKMILTDESWHVVRNARGVTGFVGPGSRPVPLTDKEIAFMGVEYVPIVLDIEIGQSVRVMNGPLENFVGVVDEIYTEKQKVRVIVEMFGRETPVELDYISIQKL